MGSNPFRLRREGGKEGRKASMCHLTMHGFNMCVTAGISCVFGFNMCGTSCVNVAM